MQETLSDKAKILERLTVTRIGKDVLSSNPKVSVIIPAYNISEFVVETLDSVFQQTYKNFEVIIVNDGSKDTVELEKALEPYFDKIIYGKQKNFGAPEARNSAICLSRGDIIAFLDGDDIWLPNYLESQMNFLMKSGFDMIYCDLEFFGDNYFGSETYMETTPSKGEVNPISLINASCNVATSGTILKKEKLAKYGLFDVDIKRAQDFELWFRLAKNGVRIGYQRKVLLKYRVSSNSLSGSNIQRAERNVSILQVIQNKYELTDEEKEVLEKQIAFSEAEVELEKGKYNLTQGEYLKANIHISKANNYYKKPKLTLIKWLIKFFPSLTLKLFKRFRPTEFSFISCDNPLDK